MQFLPVFLKVKHQPCLVVGGGEVAYRKVTMLLRAEARVIIVSPECVSALEQLARDGRVEIIRRCYEPNDLEGKRLVISATNDPACNQSIFEQAEARHLPVNVVDQPSRCSFIFPAIVDRDPVLVAVSTGGASPVLARLLRAQLERWVPQGYGALAGLAEAFRAPVKAAISGSDARRRFWEKTLEGTIAQLALSGRMDEARSTLEASLESAKSSTAQTVPGFVSLVGAGPGDPDLLTLKAFRVLQEADVIVYDRLVSDDILRLARTDAERIHVGKSQSFHTLPQDEINDLLVKKAQEGLHVVRLKGGDPFIFGRGGEEIETLVEAGLSFQVVPGITAATGCAAYAGIPLTHRDFSQGVTFVTGHTKDGSIEGINWPQLVDSGHTLVIYMGLQALPLIREALIAAGAPGSRPSAMVEKGTTAEQRVVTGTLDTLHEKAVAMGISSPALIIIGDVVQLEQKLRWFGP